MALVACDQTEEEPPTPVAAVSYSPVAIESVPGWNADNLSEALPAWRHSCQKILGFQPTRELGPGVGTAGDWQGPCQQSSRPMSLREQYMLKQQQQQQQQQQNQQQHAAQGSPSNSVISSQFLTPASSSPPSSKALNGSATPLGFEAKREKERQEATLHDPFASLAINAGLTPKKGVTTKSASSSPPTSSSGQKRVVNSEMGTPPQRPSTLQRSPTNPFDNDFKYPKI